MAKERTYIAIDLKSFYGSVECVERHFDPLTTNLVVADASRTEKTICLAVTPSLKAYGISGRARLFEVVQRVKEVNAERLRAAIKGGYVIKGGTGSITSLRPPLMPMPWLRILPWNYRIMLRRLECGFMKNIAQKSFQSI